MKIFHNIQAMLLLTLLLCLTPDSVDAKENRGLFAFITGNYVQLSWRMRATDNPQKTTYLLYAGDKAGAEKSLVGTYTSKTTARLPKDGYGKKFFKVVVKDSIDNIIDSISGVSVKEHPYLDIPLTSPCLKDVKADTIVCSYTPGDCSAYDMDGDGEQEIILKWMPSIYNKVVGDTTYTGHEFLDCYKLDGTRLWRIDTGQNTNAGNNFAFFCWDFDGDGKGEMMIKTAPGSMDATGAYVGSAAHSATGENLPGYDADLKKVYYRGSDGIPTADVDANGNQISHEWITVFSWEGKELGSRQYWPYFMIHDNWKTGGGTDGRGYGRRGCSQKGGVMKLPCRDGVTRPTACFQRGAYTYVYCTDFSWDGKTLKEEWRCASEKPTDNTITSPNKDNFCSYTVNYNADGTVADTTYQAISLFSEGAHPSEVADLDGDGYDELCIGAAAIDHDGKVLWSTSLGHGDAVHVGELNPDNEGLEVFRITEGATTYDACMLDAKTGKVLNGQLYTSGDVSRGLALDIDDKYPGNEYMYFGSPQDIYDANGNKICNNPNGVMSNNGMPNYRLYWDGDLLDEHLSGTKVSKFNTTAHSFGRLNTFSSNTGATQYHCSTINGTKANPCLQCDLFGDWREELVYYVYPTSDPEAFKDLGDADYLLRVITSHYDTSYKLPWLRDDNTYNMEIACQNIGYSMPPHLGYNPVIYYEGMGRSFGTDEVVKDTTTWTFDGADFKIPNETAGVVCNNKLYGNGCNGSASKSWRQTATSNALKFSDGTEVTPTQCLQLTYSSSAMNITDTTTASSPYVNGCLALNAKTAGTFYVLVSTYSTKWHGIHRIFFNGSEVATTGELLSTDGIKELSYTSNEAGTFFFLSGNYCNVYAIRFVPDPNRHIQPQVEPFIPQQGVKYSIMYGGKYMNGTYFNKGIGAGDNPYYVYFEKATPAGSSQSDEELTYKIKVKDDAYLADVNNTSYSVMASSTGTVYTLGTLADGTVTISDSLSNSAYPYLVKRNGYDEFNKGVTPTGFTIVEAPMEEMSIAIDATEKYITYCAPFELSVPSGVTAYSAQIKDSLIVLTQLQSIPSDKPVLLYAENGYDKTVVGGYARYPYSGICYDSILTGVLKSDGVAVTDSDYILRNYLPGGNTAYMAFCKAGTTPVTVEKYQAYISAAASRASGATAHNRLLLPPYNRPSAIQSAFSTRENIVPVAVCDANGQLRSRLHKGLNVVRFSDGSSRKVLVK